MHALVHRFEAAADRFPVQVVLILNVLLALFVGVAHGGALIVSRLTATAPQEAALIRNLATITLPLAAALLATSILSALRPRLRPPVLAAHAFVLLTGAVGMMVWGVNIIATGLPLSRFAWTPGFFTLLVFYAAYLFRRFVLLPAGVHDGFAYHSHLAAAGLAVVVEAGVLVRLVQAIRRTFFW
jgi:hypothetical protein